MSESNDLDFSEDLKKKAEDIKNRAEANELKRIEQTISERARELYRLRDKDNIERHRSDLLAAGKIRERDEQNLFEREKFIKQELLHTRQKKEDQRKRELEEKRKREEEEAKRRAEEEKRKLEEERIRLQEERQRQLAEEMRRVEEERLRREEEEHRRQEEEKLRREEQTRREIEKRELRVTTMLQQAEIYLAEGKYDLALIETAKALVNIPDHRDAINLREKITGIQKASQKTTVEIEPPQNKEQPPIPPKKPLDIKSKPETATTPEILDKMSSQRKISFTIGGIIIIIGLIFFINYLFIFFAPPVSIVVMPLKSDAGVLQDDIRGKAISEEIVTRLTTIKKIIPMGYASALLLSQTGDDIFPKVRQAGFKYVLEGTITHSENVIVINLHLSDSSKESVWSKKIERNVVALNELSTEVIKELSDYFNVPIDEKNRFVSKIPTSNANAYLMYLRGMEMMHRKTLASVSNAQELFEAAATDAPDFTEALAAIGFSSLVKIENNWLPKAPEFNRAEKVLQKAYITDKNNPVVKRTMGLLYTYQNKFDKADVELNEAVKLAPNDAEGYITLGKYYTRIGKYSDARDALLRAYELDPYNFELIILIASVEQLLNNYTEAYTLYQKVIPMIPDNTTLVTDNIANIILFDPAIQLKHSRMLITTYEKQIGHQTNNFKDMYRLARVYQSTGKVTESNNILEKARDILKQEINLNPRNPILEVFLALVNTRLGKYDEAVASAKNALKMSPDDADINYKVAQMYAIQKHSYEALEMLKKAVSLHFDLNMILDIDFFNIRTSPEFIDAIKIKQKTE